MSRNTKWFLAIVFSMVGIAWGLTKTTSLWIVNSQIDSTPIGQSTPAAINATTLNASSVNSSSLSVGSGLSGLTIVPGTSIPSRRGVTFGPDPSGDLTLWFHSYQNNSGVFFRNGADSSTAGAFTPTGTLLASSNGNVDGLLNGTQGAYVMWNMTNGEGETDFVNNRGGDNGGFNWYNATLSGATGSPIMTLNSSGILTAALFNGPLNGNASSATTANQLSGSPSQCGDGSYSTGIQQNGNANCVSFTAPQSGYAQLPGGLYIEWGTTGTFDTGPQTITLPHQLPNQLLSVTATNDDGCSGGNDRIWDVSSFTTTGFRARNSGTGCAHWIAIGR